MKIEFHGCLFHPVAAHAKQCYIGTACLKLMCDLRGVEITRRLPSNNHNFRSHSFQRNGYRFSVKTLCWGRFLFLLQETSLTDN